MTDNMRRELFRLTGDDDYTSGVPRRYLQRDDLEVQRAKRMPGVDELTKAQFEEAVQRIHEDTRQYPTFPWKSLHELSGPMCPEDLVIVAARTGGGKSLFLQNLFDALIRAGRFGLYAGLEQKPSTLRLKWACLASDVPPKLILAPGELQGTPTWHDAKAKVEAHLEWQRSPDIKVRAHFAADRKINAAGLARWTEWAVDHGAEFIIVDHIDRVEHGEGRNPFHEMSQTIRDAKELAAKNRVVMILASQLGRPNDSLARFFPPTLHELRGGGTKEEEADTVIGVYRPLRTDATEKDLKAVRTGLKQLDSVIAPNVMGVTVLKHRLDGVCAGKTCTLAVHHQRVENMPEADRWTTDGYYPRQIV